MKFNCDFLIAGIFLITVIVVHYLIHPRAKDINNRFLGAIIVVVTIDVILDLVTAIFVMHPAPSLRWLAVLLHTLFYISQVLVPFLMLTYSINLRRISNGVMVRKFKNWMIPTAAMIAMVLVNSMNGMMFTYDALGVFKQGPLYYSIHIFAGIYGFSALVGCLINKDKLSDVDFSVICQFFILDFVCISIQALEPELLLTGFAMALGILVIYVSIGNPSITIDSLTNTFDRKQLFTVIDQYLESNKKFYLVVIDIQHLHEMNIAFGTASGDEVLKDIASKLIAIDEHIDVYRKQGSRYILFCNSLKQYDFAFEKAKEIFRNNPFNFLSEKSSLPAYICGIKNAYEMESTSEIQRYTDYLVSVLNKLKQDTVIEGDDNTLKGYKYQQRVEEFLKTAVNEDLFEVYFQPIYNVKTFSFTSIEALSRLKHPELGYISPGIFIPMAEKENIISQIDMLQMEKICKFLKENPELMVSIDTVKFNLSPSSIIKSGYIESLLKIIKDYKLPGNWFQFEITEYLPTEYNIETYHTISAIKEMGAAVCLDDFGEGYSNLNSIFKFPFDEIKLDSSLLAGVETNEQSRILYRHTINTLQDCGYKVIAEGVENKQVCAMIISWGIDMIQGYYYSKPVAMKDIIEVVTKNENLI